MLCPWPRRLEGGGSRKQVIFAIRAGHQLQADRQPPTRETLTGPEDEAAMSARARASSFGSRGPASRASLRTAPSPHSEL